MDSTKARASIDVQESKIIRLSTNLNKRSSFHATVSVDMSSCLTMICLFSRLFERRN